MPDQFETAAFLDDNLAAPFAWAIKSIQQFEFNVTEEEPFPDGKEGHIQVTFSTAKKWLVIGTLTLYPRLNRLAAAARDGVGLNEDLSMAIELAFADAIALFPVAEAALSGTDAGTDHFFRLPDEDNGQAGAADTADSADATAAGIRAEKESAEVAQKPDNSLTSDGLQKARKDLAAVFKECHIKAAKTTLRAITNLLVVNGWIKNGTAERLKKDDSEWTPDDYDGLAEAVRAYTAKLTTERRGTPLPGQVIPAFPRSR